MDSCPNDPNLRTINRIDLEKENERISKLDKVKSYHSDTAVQTTHFLKKCAIVNDKPEEHIDPFKRGALTFDDVSYGTVNQYVLLNLDPSSVATDKLTRKSLLELNQPPEDQVTDSECSDEEVIDEAKKRLVFFDEQQILDIKNQQ